METLHQRYHTVPVNTPRIRLIRQSQWTPPASDWSNSHSGHSQSQADHTVSVDTLQPQADQTMPVDILNLELTIHIGLLTTSDWLHVHIGPPASYWRDSPSAPYSLRLIRYSQWTLPSSKWSDSPSTMQPPTDQTVPADTAEPQTDQQTRWTH